MTLRGVLRVLVYCAIAFVAAGQNVAAPTARDEAKKQSSKLVEDAAVAEAGGAIDNSTDLLHAAIKSDRNNALAHWRLGELQANKQWVRVEDAQKQAASDRRLPEYQDLRAAASDTLEDQLALAKWCRKAGLFDEARYHWANVLAADPNNADALRALNVRWVCDRLRATATISGDTHA